MEDTGEARTHTPIGAIEIQLPDVPICKTILTPALGNSGLPGASN